MAGGLVVRTNEGTTYFIRDEILAACEVQPSEMADTEAMVEESSEVSGFGFSFVQPVSYPGGGSTSIKTPANTPDLETIGANLGRFRPGGEAESTIMCCW